MATPMTAAQQVERFEKEGIRYKPYKGWVTWNRNHQGDWGPVHGLMVHHTGSDSTSQAELLRSGHKTLPGPLSQYGISQDGTLWLIGNGRCNHAGLGDPDVLDAVIAENYGARPPTDNQATVDGNARFYGVEIWYSGSHGMTNAQYSTLLKLSAAICKFHKWTAKSVIGHGEWQPGKWDPGYSPGKMMDMNAVRNDIADVLAGIDDDFDGVKDADEKGTTKPEPEPEKGRVYDLKPGDTIRVGGSVLKITEVK